MIKVLTKSFRSEGFDVLNVRNGKQGLSMSLKERPDLILLDIVMPKMDGMTMLSKLREDQWGKKVPVILLTNLNDSKKAIEGMQSGVHDYLVKSDWKLEDIVKKVKERLS